MFHFCPEELYMIMASMPFIGSFWVWLRSKIKWSNKSCPNRKKDSSEQKQDNEAILSAVTSLPSAPKKGDTVSLSDALTKLIVPRKSHSIKSCNKVGDKYET